MGDKETETRYKIGEVCRLADVQPYVLRYWEAEFPVLAPDKSAQGPRSYSAQDLKTVERIKQLLYDEGYTIAGAKKRLEAELRDGGTPVAAEPPPAPQPPPPHPAPSPATSAQTSPVEPPRPRRGRGRDTSPVVQATLDEAVAPETPEPAPAAVFSEPPPAESPADVSPFDVVPPPPVDPDPFAPVETPKSLVTTAKVKAYESRVDPAPAPVVQPPDPRVAPALAELRAILALLSREEP